MNLIEFISSLDPAVLAAIFTALGGILLKVVEKILNRRTATVKTRQEFREEWKELLERVDAVEAEVDAWRQKYYRGQEEILTLKAMILGAGMQIPDDIRSLTEDL